MRALNQQCVCCWALKVSWLVSGSFHALTSYWSWPSHLNHNKKAKLCIFPKRHSHSFKGRMKVCWRWISDWDGERWNGAREHRVSDRCLHSDMLEFSFKLKIKTGTLLKVMKQDALYSWSRIRWRLFFLFVFLRNSSRHFNLYL